MCDDEERMNKAERLALAAAVAPELRTASAKTRTRRVALVDKDGNVTGYTTVAEVQKQILARAKIELEVAEGRRPEKIICKKCGKVSKTPTSSGTVPIYCVTCRETHCQTCGSTLGKRYGTRRSCQPCYNAKRANPHPNCIDCGVVVGQRRASHRSTRLGHPPRCKVCAQTARRKQPKFFDCPDCKCPNVPDNWKNRKKREAGGTVRCRECAYKMLPEIGRRTAKTRGKR